MRYDCLVISDLHLGSDVCQARLLEEFLEWAVDHTRELVINGDIFDDLNFKRLTKRHFACLKVIRRNSDRDDFRLVWVRGNHDGPADIVSHIVGVEILDEYVYRNGQIQLLILHGDQFDTFITHYRWLTAIGCGLFYYIQKWMPHRASRWVRRISKRWQRNSQLDRATGGRVRPEPGLPVRDLRPHPPAADVAEVDGVRYLNSGTWTEHPPARSWRFGRRGPARIVAARYRRARRLGTYKCGWRRPRPPTFRSPPLRPWADRRSNLGNWVPLTSQLLPVHDTL